MQSTVMTPNDYLDSLSADRRQAMEKLRSVILANIDADTIEEMSYGMIGYVVPHSVYPAGYHCNPKLPLPFISIASQKNFIALYHMGLYSDPELLEWFTSEYPKHSSRKLDMGKSCIRFKNPDEIPLDLIGELVAKMDSARWIAVYEANYKSGNPAKAK